VATELRVTIPAWIDVLLFLAAVASTVAVTLYAEIHWPDGDGAWRWVHARPKGSNGWHVALWVRAVLYLTTAISLSWMGPIALAVAFIVFLGTVAATRWLYRSATSADRR
jgi:antibiotic biosynthesis monooxygenase (ABM) superfamily enzyme